MVLSANNILLLGLIVASSELMCRMCTVKSPSRRVAILIEPYVLSRNSSKACHEKEIQQVAAIHRLHVFTQAHVFRAEVGVHVVQPMGHGVDGIDDKAHLAVLNVIVLQTFVTCSHMREQ